MFIFIKHWAKKTLHWLNDKPKLCFILLTVLQSLRLLNKSQFTNNCHNNMDINDNNGSDRLETIDQHKLEAKDLKRFRGKFKDG